MRLNGEVVEDRVLPVRQAVRIGEAAGASVSFPGADLVVVRMGADLVVRGRSLSEGRGVGLSLGQVRVWLEHTAPASIPGDWLASWDFRFLAVALAVTLAALWVDTLAGVMDRVGSSGLLSAQAARLLGNDSSTLPPWLMESGRNTSVVGGGGDSLASARGDQEPRQGPRASSDDDKTGIAYYEWYRVAAGRAPTVPRGAAASLELDSSNITTRRQLAQAAYQADDFETSVLHYRWLTARVQGDSNLLLRRAMAERRLGRHLVEVRLYLDILEMEPENARVLGRLSVAVSRLGRYDEAERILRRARLLAPEQLTLDLAEALVASAQRQEQRSLECMERLLEHRDALTPAERLELAADIAIDPLFSRLRADGRFRALMAAQLGAASPRPARGGSRHLAGT